MALSRAKKIIRTRDNLKSRRSTYTSLCDEVSRYFAPELEDMTRPVEGAEILQPLISTGILANQRMVSGLYSNTMSMSKGRIENPDEKLMDLGSVKEGYSKLSQAAHHRLNQSDFPERYHEMLQAAPRGAGIIYQRWNRNKAEPEFVVYPVTRCFWTLDVHGELAEVYRECEYSANQAVEEFGYEKVPEPIQKAFDNERSSERFEFVHCLRRRLTRNRKSTASKDMPFESIYVEVSKAKIVKESGTKHMRYVLWRFYTKDGEETGRSPSMQALPVIRTLMKAVSDHMDGTELAVAPPIFLPDRNAMDRICLEAFGVNFYDASKEKPWLYQIDSRALQLSADFLNWLKEEIEKLHFVDLFTLLEQLKGDKTAYEVSQLVAERTQAIAPVANSLSRFFKRVYYLLAHDLIDNGLVDDLPPEVLASDMVVKYTSRLDVRLSEMETVALMDGVAQSAQLAQMYESSIYVKAAVDIMPAIAGIMGAHGLDPDSIRNPDEAQKELERLLEELQQSQQLEALRGMVKPVDLQTQPESGSPVDQLNQSVQV